MLPKTRRGSCHLSWRARKRHSPEEPTATDTHDGRLAFGQRLRRLRQDADLSGKELAERLGWPASKVSRLEHGTQTASVADVEAWTRALDAEPTVRDVLVEDLRSLRVEYATWRRQIRHGFADRQRAGQAIEDGTQLQRTVQTAVVPGLLQTADYARAVYRGLAELHGAKDVEAAVSERLKRQEILYRRGRTNRFLVTEGALRTRLAPVGVLRGQLDRLLTVAGLETVELAVLPHSAELTEAPIHGFVIYDDRLVLVETLTAELALREPDDIALYVRVFDMYWGAALHGDEAAKLITRIALELP